MLLLSEDFPWWCSSLDLYLDTILSLYSGTAALKNACVLNFQDHLLTSTENTTVARDGAYFSIL